MNKLKKIIKSFEIEMRGLSPDNIFRRTFKIMLLNYRRMRFFLSYYGKPVDEQIILIEAFQGRKYCDSPRSIYEELVAQDVEGKYIYVWAFVEGKVADGFRESTNSVMVRRCSEEYYSYFARAKYIITNSRMLPHIKIKKDQVVLQTWHGTPLKRLGCDIKVDHQNPYNTVNQIYRQYELEARRMTYLISPSQYATEKLKSTFNLDKYNKEDCVIEEGYPRNDYLRNYQKEDIGYIKKKLRIPKDKKVILYAPTYRDNKFEKGVGYTYDSGMDFESLEKALGEEFVILFRAHYFVAKTFDFEKYNNFILNVSDVEEINDLYIISDILVTDYSSVFFDYSNLGRPILFYMYDLEEYQNELRGFYLELEELPGPVLKDESELIKAIKKLKDKEEECTEKVKIFSDRFNYLDDGNATKRVIEKVGFFNEQ